MTIRGAQIWWHEIMKKERSQKPQTTRRIRRSKRPCVIYARYSGYDTMSACDFKKINKSDGNRGVANVVSVVATFPVRLRSLRGVCVLCVQK